VTRVVVTPLAKFKSTVLVFSNQKMSDDGYGAEGGAGEDYDYGPRCAYGFIHIFFAD